MRDTKTKVSFHFAHLSTPTSVVVLTESKTGYFEMLREACYILGCTGDLGRSGWLTDVRVTWETVGSVGEVREIPGDAIRPERHDSRECECGSKWFFYFPKGDPLYVFCSTCGSRKARQ